MTVVILLGYIKTEHVWFALVSPALSIAFVHNKWVLSE